MDNNPQALLETIDASGLEQHDQPIGKLDGGKKAIGDVQLPSM